MKLLVFEISFSLITTQLLVSVIHIEQITLLLLLILYIYVSVEICRDFFYTHCRASRYLRYNIIIIMFEDVTLKRLLINS